MTAGRRRPSGRIGIGIAVGAVGVAGIVAGITVSIDGSGTSHRQVSPPGGAADPEAVRAAAVQRVLDARAAAVHNRDEQAFLATVDDRDSAFVDRQRSLFGSLSAVPFSSFGYELGRGPGRTGDGTWEPPEVTLRYQISDYDPTAVSLRQHDTFTLRDGRWLLADDDLGPVLAGGPQNGGGAGEPTQPAIWDLGAVSVVRGDRSLVIGTGSPDRLRDIATETDRDIPDITAVWGPDWAQRALVVVPSTTAQFVALTGQHGDVSKLEAVQSAEQRGDAGAEETTGNRITINPEPYGALSSAGRRVVVTHELTHVATRASTGAQTPLWLAEGFADYVGFLRSGIPVPDVTTELRGALVTGGLPPHLPVDGDFAVGSAQPAVAYEESWLACRLIVRTGDQAALVAFYRAVGQQPAPAGTAQADVQAAEDRAVAAGLARSGLATLASPAAFTAGWRDSLATLLG